MKLAWSSDGLRQVCVSEHGLDVAAPGDADDARLLLTAIARADGLPQLDRLNCVTVERAGAAVVVRLGAVEIDAVLVRPAGGLHQVRELHVRMGLMIRQIRVAGQPLLCAAG